MIKGGRTGRGVYYILNPTYKGGIRGQKIIIDEFILRKNLEDIVKAGIVKPVSERRGRKYILK